MKELCFKLIKKEVEIDEDFVIDSFISFALENEVSFGGGCDGGCLVDERNNIHLELKQQFIDYLNLNHQNLFKEIRFQFFNVEFDCFEETERIKLE